MIALGHVFTEGEYQTLVLADSAREVLRGGVELQLRVSTAPTKTARGATTKTKTARAKADALDLDADQLARFEALKAWRSEVAKEHGLPAYVIFQNVTLAEMAKQQPSTLDELGGISGVGAKKLEAYGRELLRVLESS